MIYCKIFQKKSAEKFGGEEKVRIFAVRLRNNDTSLRFQKQNG